MFADSFQAPSLPLFLLPLTCASWSERSGALAPGPSHKFKPQRAAAPTAQPHPLITTEPQGSRPTLLSQSFFWICWGAFPDILRNSWGESQTSHTLLMRVWCQQSPRRDQKWAGSLSISGDDPNRRGDHNTSTKKWIVIWNLYETAHPIIFIWQTIYELSSSRLFPLSHRWALQLQVSKPCSKAGRGKKIVLLVRLGFFIWEGKVSPGASGSISLCECARGGTLAATETRKLSILTFHNRKNKG